MILVMAVMEVVIAGTGIKAMAEAAGETLQDGDCNSSRWVAAPMFNNSSFTALILNMLQQQANILAQMSQSSATVLVHISMFRQQANKLEHTMQLHMCKSH